MKIYVAGKVSGLPLEHTKEKFKWHAAFLSFQGNEVINPMVISPFDESKTWEDYISECIPELLKCDAIYLLRDWGQSKGARIEYVIAKELGLKIIFEGEYE